MKKDLPINNLKSLSTFIETIIRDNIAIEAFAWLKERIEVISSQNNAVQLPISFAAISRKIEKKTVRINSVQEELISGLLPGLFIQGWTFNRLCRAYILMALNAAEKTQYCTAIESLFINADMNERADLYAALPILVYPQYWVNFCVEGIRSNLGVVQEAIMYQNPFPAQYLEEAAWNQLVLKAFFTDKNINLIYGIDEKANAPLALTLINYAKERWAAKRTVNCQLWRLVAKFIDNTNIEIITKLFISEDENTRLAAGLACSQSNYLPARALLDLFPETKNNLNWGNIGS